MRSLRTGSSLATQLLRSPLSLETFPSCFVERSAQAIVCRRRVCWRYIQQPEMEGNEGFDLGGYLFSGYPGAVDMILWSSPAMK